MERLIGQLGSAVKSRKHPEAHLLASCHVRFTLRALHDKQSLSGDDVRATDERGLEIRANESESIAGVGAAQTSEVRGVRADGRRARDMAVEWAVEDKGLLESSVGDAQVVQKLTIGHGEFKV